MSYIRQGHCSPNCGACCRSLRLQVPPEYGANPDIKHWIELHGVRLVQQDGGTFVVLNLQCEALQEDSSCGLYGKPERPELCSAWPATPAALAPVADVCSYSFILEEVLV